jgi:putative transposase
LALEEKRRLIVPDHNALSIVRQCELLGLNRSNWYYRPRGISQQDLEIMRLLDEQYTRTPFFGVRRMKIWLAEQGQLVNHKRIRRLMQFMGIEAIYPKPKLSQRNDDHKIYPYLLRNLAIDRSDQVWASDITYIRMRRGFVYLVAIMDWFSRYVLSWSISVTMDVYFCLEALEKALAASQPEIFNTDQGSQFTSREFTGRLSKADVRISMDGKGRAFDNIFIERLWRSVKYEEIYLKEYPDVPACIQGLRDYFRFYNQERPHQALGYRTPVQVYLGRNE